MFLAPCTGQNSQKRPTYIPPCWVTGGLGHHEQRAGTTSGEERSSGGNDTDGGQTPVSEMSQDAAPGHDHTRDRIS